MPRQQQSRMFTIYTAMSVLQENVAADVLARLMAHMNNEIRHLPTTVLNTCNETTFFVVKIFLLISDFLFA